MSKERFEHAIMTARLSKNSKAVPRWLGRYAAFVKCGGDSPVPVDQERRS